MTSFFSCYDNQDYTPINRCESLDMSASNAWESRMADVKQFVRDNGRVPCLDRAANLDEAKLATWMIQMNLHHRCHKFKFADTTNCALWDAFAADIGRLCLTVNESSRYYTTN